MSEKRLVQWYAADAGVDLDIAEREIALTYVLRVMIDRGLSKYWAFKGGTAIRKLYLGNQGRFSLDLDFSAVGEIDPETLILDIVSAFHEKVHGKKPGYPTACCGYEWQAGVWERQPPLWLISCG